jgi:hypothetical protein
MQITCHYSFLQERCKERGYIIDEVMPCVISISGDNYTIDTDHPAYPKQPKYIIRPGQELSTILGKFGLHERNNCSCKDRAFYMDSMELQEPGWCEKNIDIIVGWLEEEAKNRHLPFSKIAAKALVKLAIYRAKKKANIK